MKNSNLNLFSNVNARQKYKLCLVLLCSVLLSLISVISVYVQKKLVDSLNGYDAGGVCTAIFVIAVSSLASIAISGYVDIQKTLLSSETSKQIALVIYDKLKSVRLVELEDKETINLVNRIQTFIPTLSDNILNRLDVVFIVENMLTMVVVLTTIRWYFILIALAFTIPYFALIRTQGFENYRYEVENNTDSRKICYIFDLLTLRNYVKEIRIFRLKDYLQKYYSDLRKGLWANKKSLLWKHSLRTIFITLLKNLSLFICLMITGALIMDNMISLGNFMIVISGIQGVQSAIKELFMLYDKINKEALYKNDLKGFLN